MITRWGVTTKVAMGYIVCRTFSEQSDIKGWFQFYAYELTTLILFCPKSKNYVIGFEGGGGMGAGSNIFFKKYVAKKC